MPLFEKNEHEHYGYSIAYKEAFVKCCVSYQVSIISFIYLTKNYTCSHIQSVERILNTTLLNQKVENYRI